MDLQLKGRTALVAGASRGIGEAVAECLVREGAHVGLLARDAAALQSVADRLGERSFPMVADVCDDSAVDGAIDALARRFDAPTILVWAVAARFEHTKLPEITSERMAALLRTDVQAPARTVGRLVPGMMAARHGRVVFLGSLAASHALRGAPLYGASKAALEGLARAIAVDHGRFGVTANVVRLGVVPTERLQSRGVDVQAWRQRSPTRKLVSVQQAASTITWLCGEPAAGVNGAVLDVTAGMHLSGI